MNRNRTTAALAATILSFVIAGQSLAHGPDPILGIGTLWKQDQVVPYQWQTGSIPPASIATAIDLGAGDVGESRASRAAVFVRAASAPGKIAYGGWNPCDSYGIACADRTGMTNGVFGVWFRPHGWAFDWGTLRWCQIDSSNGCYDIEQVGLNELGHIEVLGHHVNFSDESDYTDALVQFAGRAKPRTGWDFHAYGRCDIARLQLEYERRDPGNPVSTCLSLASSLALAVSPTSLYVGDTARFTATLKIAPSTAARTLSGDPLSDRPVTLQRRAIGSTTWTTVGTMTPSTTEGTYALSWSPTATYDWRAVFFPAANDGVTSATSGYIRVSVSGCSVTGCPQSAPIRSSGA